MDSNQYLEKEKLGRNHPDDGPQGPTLGARSLLVLGHLLVCLESPVEWEPSAYSTNWAKTQPERLGNLPGSFLDSGTRQHGRLQICVSKFRPGPKTLREFLKMGFGTPFGWYLKGGSPKEAVAIQEMDSYFEEPRLLYLPVGHI